jgi:hypothetical protein
VQLVERDTRMVRITAVGEVSGGARTRLLAAAADLVAVAKACGQPDRACWG